MKRSYGGILWFLLLVIGFTGCENSENRRKLIGVWKNEPFLLQGQNVPKGAIVMEFREDGVVSRMAKRRPPFAVVENGSML